MNAKILRHKLKLLKLIFLIIKKKKKKKKKKKISFIYAYLLDHKVLHKNNKKKINIGFLLFESIGYLWITKV